MRRWWKMALIAWLASVWGAAPASADVDRWQDECLRGQRKACRSLAWDERLAGNKASARGWYERACSLGDKPSCFDMAMLSDALGDAAKAREGFARACREGEKRACVRVGKQQSPDQIAWQSDCDQGRSAACFALAGERRRANDLTGEQKLLERACRLGSVDGCLASAERIGSTQACYQGGRQVCLQMLQRLEAMGRTQAAAEVRAVAAKLAH